MKLIKTISEKCNNISDLDASVIVDTYKRAFIADIKLNAPKSNPTNHNFYATIRNSENVVLGSFTGSLGNSLPR